MCWLEDQSKTECRHDYKKVELKRKFWEKNKHISKSDRADKQRWFSEGVADRKTAADSRNINEIFPI